MVEPSSRHLLHEMWEGEMTHVQRRRLRDRHRSYLSMGFEVCSDCSDIDFVGRIIPYPCDVIKVLDYLDVVEPMPQDTK